MPDYVVRQVTQVPQAPAGSKEVVTEHLVRAVNQVQARAHVAQNISASLATTEDVIRLTKAGVEMVDLTAEPPAAE